MNPFLSFCLYVAARVFVQYLKSRPDDSQTADSLRFLLAAMNALKRKNPLTESFLVQLDVDLEALGSRIPKLKAAFPRSSDSVSNPKPAVPTGRRANNNPQQPVQGVRVPPMVRQGVLCEEGPGIMSFRDGCDFVGPGQEEGTSPCGEAEAGKRPTTRNTSGAGSSWLGADQQLPTRERSVGHSPPVFSMHGVSFGSISANQILSTSSCETNDTSTTPDGQSNRPTPNSSAASEHRQGLAPGPLNTSGRNSFSASPVSPNQNIGNQAEMERSVSAFFNDPDNSFSMGTGMTPMMTAETPGNEFTVPAGWEIPGQTGMTPGAEGVLRTIMQMGPMETMDLGWDSNQ